MPEVEIFIQGRESADGFNPDVDRRMFQYAGLEVVAGISDSRVCKFTCPITDTNALNQSNVQHFLPGERMVSVKYRGRPVFWGPIIKPIFNFKENRVEVNAHDPSIYWKGHHIDTIEAEDEDTIKVNGAGLETLQRMADVTAAEFADGAVDPGVTNGGDVEDYLLPGEDPGERRTMKFRNGDNIFDSIQTLAEAADGPEWELVPVDETHDLDGLVSVGPGYYTALRAVAELGTDKRDEVIFHYGHGHANLDNFIYEPDFTTAISRYVATNARGAYRVAKFLDGYHRGIMEVREELTGGRAPRPAALELKARQMVEAYGNPLETFTIEPTWDQGVMGSAASTPWRFPTGYTIGDRIRVVAKKDRMYVDLVGRVVKVTLTQLNAAENVRAQIECIPQPDDIEDDVTVGTEIQ